MEIEYYRDRYNGASLEEWAADMRRPRRLPVKYRSAFVRWLIHQWWRLRFALGYTEKDGG